MIRIWRPIGAGAAARRGGRAPALLAALLSLACAAPAGAQSPDQDASPAERPAAGADAAPAEGIEVLKRPARKDGAAEDDVDDKAAAAAAARRTLAWRFIDGPPLDSLAAGAAALSGGPPTAAAGPGAETAGETAAEPARVRGVMRVMADSLQPAASERRIGLFLFDAGPRGVFEGVYNVKADGMSVVGTFWAEGAFNSGTIAGVLELSQGEDGAGAGRAVFTDGGVIEGLTAR